MKKCGSKKVVLAKREIRRVQDLEMLYSPRQYRPVERNGENSNRRYVSSTPLTTDCQLSQAHLYKRAFGALCPYERRQYLPRLMWSSA